MSGDWRMAALRVEFNCLFRTVAWLACLIGAICGPSTLAATNGASRFSVRIWQMDDGLPQNSVWSITQTTDGYLWVGTHEGLARFDGTRFRVLDEPEAPELK